MPESRKRKPRKGRTASGRQSPTEVKVERDEPSPTWYVVTMTGLMAVGVVLVLLRFVFDLDQWVLLVGLGMIAGGFLMTTGYR
ncbi:MAG: cell division protein CrgA [Acidimicrobiia bacterium]|jgi:hypothetical protein